MKIFLSLLILAASAYGAPTTVDPTGSTPPPTHDDWAHFHRQVQVQVFQLEASLHELEREAALPLHAGHVVVLQHIIARDEATVATIQKEVEAEAKHNLSDTEKAFITETTTTLDHVKKQLAKLYETLSIHKNTTPSSFEAETVATTVKPKEDFKTFQQHTELSLSHVKTSVEHIESDETKNHTPEQIAKLKAQVQKDLEEVDKLEKKVESEAKKASTDEEKAFITKTEETLKDLKTRLNTAQEKVGKLVAGTTKTPKQTTVPETTKPAFFAETATPAVINGFSLLAFQNYALHSANVLWAEYLQIIQDTKFDPMKIHSHSAQIEKALKEIPDIEKLIITTETTQHLNDKEKAFTKAVLIILEDLKKKFTELEAKEKNTTGTPKPTTGTPKATSGTPTTGTPKETVKPSTPKPTSF